MRSTLSFQIVSRDPKRSRSVNRDAGIGLTALIACLLAPPSHAESPAVPPSAQEMPQRERDLIAILAEAQGRVRTDRSVADLRVATQIRVYNFLVQDSQARNWTGTIKNVGRTREGERWIRIEIAPGITVETCPDRNADPKGITLIRPHSTVGRAIDGLAVEEAVIFSGLFMGGRVTDDTSMVEVPEMITRFDSIKRLE